MPNDHKPILLKTFEIMPRDFTRAGEVSIKIQGTLKSIGFNSDLVRRASICAYESEMNVVMYGGEAIMVLFISSDRITLDVKDDGPGIEDVDLALQEGYSTAPPEYREMGFGAGMGLPNIKKNTDSFKIYSEKGKGTHLSMDFHIDRK